MSPAFMFASEQSVSSLSVMLSFVREQTSIYITRALSSSCRWSKVSPIARTFSDDHPRTSRMSVEYLLTPEAGDVSE